MPATEGLGFRVQGLGLRAQGVGLTVLCLDTGFWNKSQ